MNLEWRLRIALWLLRRTGGGRRLATMTPEEARAALRAQTVGPRAQRLHGTPPAMAETRDVAADGPAGAIPMRLYRPEDADGSALLFFHGGGFVTGGIDEAEIECRRIAHASGRTVCSVAYRLAPEERFPAAVEDAIASVEWVAMRAPDLMIDPARMAVGGESAGATLAAVTAQLARDRGAPRIERQVLIYGGFDPAGEYPSRTTAERLPILTPADVDWSHRHYFAHPEEVDDPRATPIRGNLHGLPPALVIVAELDPLRDEGVAYADALRSAGCAVDLRSYPRQPHGFLLLGRLSGQSGQAFSDIGAFLRMPSA